VSGNKRSRFGRAPPLVNFLTIDGITGMRSFLESEGRVADIGSFAIFAGIAPEERAAYFAKVKRRLGALPLGYVLHTSTPCVCVCVCVCVFLQGGCLYVHTHPFR
jgi:hypothetical protein